MDLYSYLRLLLRSTKWLVLGVVIGLVGGVAYYEASTPIYAASTSILLQPNNPAEQANSSSTVDPVRYADDQVAVITSDPVLQDAASAVGGGVTAATLRRDVSISSDSVDDDVIVATASATSADLASREANSLATAYIADVRSSSTAQLNAAVKVIQGELTTIQSQLASNGDAINRTALQTQFQTLSNQQQQFSAEIALQNGNATILSAATPPAGPSGLSQKKAGLLGAVIGLFLAGAIVVTRKRLDRYIRDREDVEAILGAVPMVELGADTDEPVRELRTMVSRGDDLSRSGTLVMMASCGDQEGHAAVAEQLALSIAAAGYSTLLVCANRFAGKQYSFQPDLPRRSLRSMADLLRSNADEIEGLRAIEQALYDPGISNLRVIPWNDHGSSDVLMGSATMHLLDRLRHQVDVIILDVGPLLPAGDAVPIARRSTSTVLVIGTGTTRRDELGEVDEMLERYGVSLAGAVLLPPKARSARARPSKPTGRDATRSVTPLRTPEGAIAGAPSRL